MERTRLLLNFDRILNIEIAQNSQSSSRDSRLAPKHTPRVPPRLAVETGWSTWTMHASMALDKQVVYVCKWCSVLCICCQNPMYVSSFVSNIIWRKLWRHVWSMAYNLNMTHTVVRICDYFCVSAVSFIIMHYDLFYATESHGNRSLLSSWMIHNIISMLLEQYYYKLPSLLLTNKVWWFVLQPFLQQCISHLTKVNIYTNPILLSFSRKLWKVLE